MGKLKVDFPRNIARFESAMRRKFDVRTIFYKKVFRGKGLEFDGFREYVAGDDAESIDWRASMKSKRLLIKQYIEERDLKIFMIIDVGENMVLGSEKQLKNEYAAEVCAAIAHLVITSGDNFGFSLYNSKVDYMSKFSQGIRQFYRFEEHLRNTKFYGGKSDLKNALDYLYPLVKGSNAVFIVSDFLNLREEDLKSLKKFILKYETIGIMIRDPIDSKLPELDREVIVEDIYTGNQTLINPRIIGKKYEKIASEQKKKVYDFFEKNGADLLDLTTDKDFILPLVNFLKGRMKAKRFVMPRS